MSRTPRLTRDAAQPAACDVDVELPPVEVARDLNTLHDWSGRAHVREYWDLGRSRADVARYLESKIGSGYLQPHLIRINGENAGYAELYQYNLDPVAGYFPGQPGDRGWHIFLGEERFIGSGYAVYAGREILRQLFAYADCQRVLCEPDERNERMLRFVRKIGHRQVATVDLPDKRARIMECTRANFQELNL
jgi:RimJ/RimL family protein N-acetyltransferase